MDRREFELLMRTVAEGWNAGDADRAADCFAVDAVYVEPPDRQHYRGRAALLTFFRGGPGRQAPPPMRMSWHHLLFDEREQVGAGEYTFQGRNRYHGMVIVKVRAGRISHWREYQYQSTLDWPAFAAGSAF